ncbi:hypothetical protein [Cellulophaga sp. Z1A5H]|uniref:hypothetical protein n=1 Tax=Cellulophaga sp. Z1A5H TaxID=2687291 RepID=UPI0013FD2A55|nr:hypothetical protein [Cellulophaga sp. Z1A5H]
MFKIGIGLVLISLFSILSCKNKPEEVAVAFTVVDLKKHTEIDAKSNYENNKDTVIDVNRLDFLSKKVSLPYGKKEIIDYNFPDHWYCGGGVFKWFVARRGLPN